MARTPRRLAVLLAAVLAALSLTACGNKRDHSEDRVVRAETEGLYVEIGELKYQVQGSRQLNPAEPLDRAFLLGVPRAEQGLQPGETWFGVFLRVQNETEEAHEPSADIEIIDTQEKVFKPVALDAVNVFAYRSQPAIAPGDLLPAPDTPAFETPVQGALLLFKLTNTSLDNRPLELKIESPKVPQQTGIIDLDV